MVYVTYIQIKINMNKQKFMHYAFQTIMVGLGAATAGMIVFTFVTIIREMI